jgi:hypothetical protein
MSFLDNLVYLVQDANIGLNDLFTGPRVLVDNTPQGAGYSSLTAARRSFRPFIVGLIPPDIEINFKPIDQINQRLASSSQRTAASGNTSGTSGSVVGPLNIRPVLGIKNCSKDFLFKIQDACNRHKWDSTAICSCMAFETAGTFDPSIRSGHSTNPNAAVGLIQFLPKYCRTMFGKSVAEMSAMSQAEQFDLVEKWFSNQGNRLKRSPEDYYLSVIAPGGVGKPPDYHLYNKESTNPDPKLKAAEERNYADNAKSLDPEGKGYITVASATAPVRNIYNAAMKKPPITVEQFSSSDGVGYFGIQGAVGGPPPRENQPPAVDIMATGNITDMEGDDPLRVGRNIQITSNTERYQIVEKQVAQMNDQIRAAQSVPPLGMIINPADFTRSYEHSFDAPKVRRGHVVHIWLEKPLSISCKGVTAAQYILGTNGDGGLTNRFRAQSLSHLNLMSLVRIYKNNGYIFSGDAFGSGNENLPLIAMSVYIYYDGHIYLGSFDDFNITDAADKPYNLEYSFKFTARYDIDVTSITDNQISGLE